VKSEESMLGGRNYDTAFTVRAYRDISFSRRVAQQCSRRDTASIAVPVYIAEQGINAVNDYLIDEFDDNVRYGSVDVDDEDGYHDNGDEDYNGTEFDDDVDDLLETWEVEQESDGESEDEDS
jgi:hypothetical protein